MGEVVEGQPGIAHSHLEIGTGHQAQVVACDVDERVVDLEHRARRAGTGVGDPLRNGDPPPMCSDSMLSVDVASITSAMSLM